MFAQLWPDPGLPRTPLPPPHLRPPRLNPKVALLVRPAPCDCYTAAPGSSPPLHKIPLPPLAGPHATAKARGGSSGGMVWGGCLPHGFRTRAAPDNSTWKRHNLRVTTRAPTNFTPQNSHMNMRGLDGVNTGEGSGLSLNWPCAALKPQGHRPRPTVS